MRRDFRRLLRRGFYLLPRSRFLYRLCARYASYYSGENDFDMHTNGELRFLKASLPRTPGAIVFDVGANIGNWCQAVLSINPHAEVHCFEPGSSAFKQLAGRGFPHSVVCNNIGLSSAPSIQQLGLFGSKTSCSSLHPGIRYGREPEAYEEVRLETLAHYCRNRDIDRIDYLKIDVEGHELSVLQGAAEMLSEQKVCAVQFEYAATYVVAGTFLRDVFDFLAAFSYDVYKILPRGLSPIRGYHRSLETFRYSNYVLLPRE